MSNAHTLIYTVKKCSMFLLRSKGLEVVFECKSVKWCGVNWRDLCVSDFVLKWSEVKCVTVKFLGTKVPCTLGWPYTEGTWLYVLWLLHVVCILCCGCFNLFCNVRVYVCVGFVMYGCFGNICTCICCVLYCLYCVFVLFRLCILFVLSVLV